MQEGVLQMISGVLNLLQFPRIVILDGCPVNRVLLSLDFQRDFLRRRSRSCQNPLDGEKIQRLESGANSVDVGKSSVARKKPHLTHGRQAIRSSLLKDSKCRQEVESSKGIIEQAVAKRKRGLMTNANVH